MLLENEKVKMIWHPANKLIYENRGYIFTGYKTAFFPLVKDVVECSSGVKIPVKCDYCGKIYYPTSRNYNKVKERNEKDCCVSCKGKKIKATVKDKYGVDNVVYLESVQNKIKNTCLDRYGTESPLENKSIFNRTQETLYNKYGVKNCAYIQEVIDKRKETMQYRYGCDYPLQNEGILRKSLETLSKNGNCPTSSQQIELQEILYNMYGNCELNYPCDRSLLDCMIEVDGVKIDVEYDGWYWHKDKQDKDIKRDWFVKSQGYKIIRFIAIKNILPSIEQIQQSVDCLVNTNSNFIKIILE